MPPPEVSLSRGNVDPLTFHALYESAVVRVRDYCCCAGRGGPGDEEHTDGNHIVLMRRGAFSKHLGRRGVTADVNHAVFFSEGSTYRVSHPADCGDRGTVLIPSPSLLVDTIRELDPSIDDHPSQPFPFITGPTDAGTFWRHRKLVQRLELAQSAPVDPLWADVETLQLIADVLEAAHARHGLPRKRRSGTDADHADR